MKRLILLGAGHAHLFVLRHFARQKPHGVELILVSPSRWQYYSGMMPGWMAGHYRLEQCRINVQPLLKAADGRLIEQAACGLDAAQQQVTLTNGQSLTYDLLSVDVGSETDLSHLAAFAGPLLCIKPLPEFARAWQSLLQQARTLHHLAVVGGGAAGVELVLAARQAMNQAGVAPRLSLITGPEGVLTNLSESVRRQATRELQRQHIELIRQQAVANGTQLLLGNGDSLAIDAVIAATGARPVHWLQSSGLQQDAAGYLLVDACHRSLSHPNVFAAGDTCSRRDQPLQRSGVHAVRAGPILARNLHTSLTQGAQAALTPFTPRRNTLYLLACGERRAIMSWGKLSASGAWVWYLKDWIDRRFINLFSKHNGAPEPVHDHRERP